MYFQGLASHLIPKQEVHVDNFKLSKPTQRHVARLLPGRGLGTVGESHSSDHFLATILPICVYLEETPPKMGGVPFGFPVKPPKKTHKRGTFKKARKHTHTHQGVPCMYNVGPAHAKWANGLLVCSSLNQPNEDRRRARIIKVEVGDLKNQGCKSKSKSLQTNFGLHFPQKEKHPPLIFPRPTSCMSTFCNK